MAVDDLISHTFTNHLEQLLILSQHSREGKDRTAIAVCGPLCKGYIGSANDLRNKYASRLEPRQPYTTMATTDIMDSLTSLNENHIKLSQKLQAYNLFLAEASLSGDAVFKAFDGLTAEMTSYAASLNQRDPDTKLLVLIRVFHDLERLVTQHADPAFLFAITISLLPDMLSITFVALLHLVRSANECALTMRQAVRQAYEEAKWYGQMATATDTLRRSKENWRTSRRSANISEDVDRRAPDTIGSTISA
jgi:hypothetical protein